MRVHSQLGDPQRPRMHTNEPPTRCAPHAEIGAPHLSDASCTSSPRRGGGAPACHCLLSDVRVAPDGRVTFYLATLREARLARHVLSCGAPAAAPVALPFEARARVLCRAALRVWHANLWGGWCAKGSCVGWSGSEVVLW